MTGRPHDGGVRRTGRSVDRPIDPPDGGSDDDAMVPALATSTASPTSPAGPGAAPPHPPTPAWRTVLTAWFRPRTWRELAYLVAAAVLGGFALCTLLVLTWLSIVLVTVVIGIPLVAVTVLAAREWAAVPRALGHGLLGDCVPTPRRRRRRRGVIGWLRSSFSDVDGWRAIAFLVVWAPLNLVGAYLALVATAISGFCATYPVWWVLFRPENTDADGRVRSSGVQLGEVYFDTWPRALALTVVGLAGLLVVPWLVRGIVTVDRLLGRGLLGPTRTADRVEDLEATRAQAVDQSAATLRRIERDLHDGTQARLVALAMHLDMAREHLAARPDAGGDVGPDGDPSGPGAAPPPVPADTDVTEPLDPTLTAGAGAAGAQPSSAELARARELLEQAHRDALDAIVELRDVTRSIHPPALDRGLDDALATLAARSGVPIDLDVHVAARPSPAIETIAYHCAAELLTNVAKHAGATWATVVARGEAGVLRLQVTDDGRGGARVVDGGGLAGLAERVATVDGHLAVSSPAGGPTVVVVELPLSA